MARRTKVPTLIRLLGLSEDELSDITLKDGSRVAVVGGGPAGSFFAYFLLQMAQRADLILDVHIYEPRDYTVPGPASCNMCGGIISESLVQILAAEGILLPPTVIQRGIDSYVMHTDMGSVRIETPLQEMRIGAVHRGAGPRDLKEVKWDSFDGFLQLMAEQRGATIIRERMTSIHWDDEERYVINTRNGKPMGYDFVAIATGVNSAMLKLMGELDLDYKPPTATKTFIREYFIGDALIESHMGNSMHVFLLDIPRLKFAAAIPKGDYVTLCMLGEDIDQSMIDAFINAPEVQYCMPPGWEADALSCQCSPRMNIGAASRPFADRLVFIGDCGVTRLYKDGIGGAYRGAKAAASTAVFHGIAAADFERHYWPTLRHIDRDNDVGRIIFFVTKVIQKLPFARRALLRMAANEQHMESQRRRMSMILWDTFTGSASYTDIFRRTFHPAYLVRFLSYLLVSLIPFSPPAPWQPGPRSRTT